MSKIFVYEDLKKGEYFVRQGQYAKDIAFLQNGYCKIILTMQAKNITNTFFLLLPLLVRMHH
jgi:CRP-like cAMP-binding protein